VQLQEYHGFADTRAFLGVINGADTLSNLAFLLVGALGLAFLQRERAAASSERFASPREVLPYWVFFAGVALTSAGSAWYHLAPDDARLVWDRLPMTIAFMSLVAAVVSERISVRSILGRYLEHSRVFRFGSERRGYRYLIGSADLMTRNLSQRVEALVPITAPAHTARLEALIEAARRDDDHAWELDQGGTWQRAERRNGFSLQRAMQEVARAHGAR